MNFLRKQHFVSSTSIIKKSYYKDQFLKYHLPLFISAGVSIGYNFPEFGILLSKADFGGISLYDNVKIYDKFSNYCISTIFLISGLNLETKQIKQALNAKKAFIASSVSILAITPLAAFTLPYIWNVRSEFLLGLGCFLLVPTTLSVGPATTKIANGNVPLALMLTVSTNLIGAFTVPILMSKYIPLTMQDKLVDSISNAIQIDPIPMICQLTGCVVAPLIVGKLLKDQSTSINSFVEINKVKLTLLSSTALAAIPFQQASASADSFGKIPLESFVSCLVVFSVIHCGYLGINYVIARKMMKLPLEEQKAFVIMSSQKSLPVALSVLSFVPQNIVPGMGLASVPVIIAHLTQTLADSALAARWADVTKIEATKEKR